MQNWACVALAYELNVELQETDINVRPEINFFASFYKELVNNWVLNISSSILSGENYYW